jgi:murein DD-endopeptidase MepM/ murein hydrolase activator NlpD
LTQSRLLTRVLAHLTVVGLVASAAVFGISQASTRTGADGLFGFISTARAGAHQPAPLQASTFTLVPQPDAGPDFTARGGTAPLPDPLPTPVPVDPQATPLPGPNRSFVAPPTVRSGGPAVAVAPAAPTGVALAWPVPGGSVSQYFHAGHLAIDVAAPGGSTVVAAEAGVVTSAGWRNNGGGLVISIDHGNGMQTLYNHLGAVWVGAGQAVARGQAIAPVGCTGLCTGPHVHFEVIVNGVIQNPLRYL